MQISRQDSGRKNKTAQNKRLLYLPRDCVPNDMLADATKSAGEAVPGRQGSRLNTESDFSSGHDSMRPEGMNPALTAIQLPNKATSSRPLCSFFRIESSSCGVWDRDSTAR
jgi:hypothetical protein